MSMLRNTLAGLDPGAHVCPIYDQAHHRVAFLTDFIEPSLSRNERCLLVTSEPGADRLFSALDARGVDVRAQRKRGALHVLSDREVYLRKEVFSPSAMLDYLAHEEGEALRDGFSGLRYAGEMSWAASNRLDDDLIEYEARLNAFLVDRRIVVGCLYDRNRFDGAIIHDVLRVHPLVVLDDQPFVNPYYEPPDLLLEAERSATAEFKNRRVTFWIDRLRAAGDLERERDRLADQLRQSQKMEALGRLAGGVAHDFNNLLTVITGYSDLLSEMVTDDEMRVLIEEIRRACRHSSALTRQLLAFSRKELPAPTILNLNEIVADMEGILRRLLGERIRIETHLEAEPQVVRVDPGQMRQILMNLVVNARDAMPEGGTLTLRTGTLTVGAEEAAREDVEPGPYVFLSVADTGVGIPEDCRDRLFEPFFTTKETGRGTGFGLAIVHGIVKQNRGAIRVESEWAKGSTFTVLLPRAEVGGRAEASPQAHRLPVTPRHESILLVEDDESVRVLLRRILGRAGYQVLEASSGQEARGIANSEALFDLLITDVGLPDISGPRLAGELASVRPGLRTVLLSGYTAEEIGAHETDAGASRFLQKPFAPEELLTTVRETLDRVASDAVQD